MPKWKFTGNIDDDFEFDDDFNVGDDYTGFQKIQRGRRSEEELKASKKKNSVKHQKRPDKDT